MDLEGGSVGEVVLCSGEVCRGGGGRGDEGRVGSTK